MRSCGEWEAHDCVCVWPHYGLFVTNQQTHASTNSIESFWAYRIVWRVATLSRAFVGDEAHASPSPYTQAFSWAQFQWRPMRMCRMPKAVERHVDTQLRIGSFDIIIHWFFCSFSFDYANNWLVLNNRHFQRTKVTREKYRLWLRRVWESTHHACIFMLWNSRCCPKEKKNRRICSSSQSRTRPDTNAFGNRTRST